jgi:kynureninase
LQPKSASAYLEEELAAWRTLGVLGHERGRRPWIDYHEHAAAPLADLVGAAADEVVAMNSLTVNLHLMMVSFFAPAHGRDCVMIEKSAFPSDRYAVSSQLEFHGLRRRTHLLEIEPPGAGGASGAAWIEAIEREQARLALVLLPGVQYLTGERFDLQPLIAAARRAGAVVGVDLAHAIGNTPLHLHDWGADFAVWCSYKYLNAGPGAVGGCFVHARHARRFDLPRFAGWWGHDKHTRFRMPEDFSPIAGAEGWQISNPPILSSAPLLASLELFARARFERLREKSVALTGLLERALRTLAADRVEFITPEDPALRGCQLSVRLRAAPRESAAPGARRVHERLLESGVVADWREPDVLRLAPVPLYNSYTDVFTAAAALAEILAP